MTLWPLTLEITLTFFLASYLLYRYGNWTEHHAGVTVSVFIAWFFSFIVIFILPLDISSTAYRQCIIRANMTFNSSVTDLSVKGLLNLTEAGHVNSSHSLPQVFSNPPVNSSSSSNILPHNSTSFPGNWENSYNKRVNDSCGHPWSYAQQEVLITLWSLVYFSSQLLTWVALPIMQSYSMAGDFTSLGKLRSAFVENAIYYGSFALIFFVILICVMVKSRIGFSEFKAICTTASNTWGLILLVVLLGYGLVDIPRTCRNYSMHGRTLTYLYFKIAKLSGEKIEAESHLDDLLEEINCAFQTISTSNIRFRQYLNEILRKCPPDWRSNVIARYQNLERGAQARGGIAYTEKSLVRMNQAIKKAVQNHHRVLCQWENLINDAIDWEDVSRNQISLTRIFKTTFKKPPPENAILRSIKEKFYTPIEWYWKCVWRGFLFKCISYITTALTIIIVWSELTFSIHSPPLSIFALIFLYFEHQQAYFMMELFSILSIAYFCICTYYTVFKIRIFNYYYLASHHQTDEYSLIFSGMLLCRLTPPLCLNFLNLINLNTGWNQSGDKEKASFTEVIGTLEVLPKLKNGIEIYLPAIMCIFCVLTLLEAGARLKHFMGIEQFIVDDETTTDLVKEGQELLKREKNKRARMVAMTNQQEMRSRDRSFANTSHQSEPTGLPIPSSPGISPKHSTLSGFKDNGKVELLDDVEPIDYSSINAPSENERTTSRSRQPPRNIFDDI
ncbi:G-protein coupled receptor-associated protein LMBRD2 [Brevipalpus obovatus]|uniref:G-protein coupled receptor-associated protein LMBRD2 n=1 Tax=Brevipalpus obovatus TaxID=246614 RepID=UPI003D9F0F65